MGRRRWWDGAWEVVGWGVGGGGGMGWGDGVVGRERWRGAGWGRNICGEVRQTSYKLKS